MKTKKKGGVAQAQGARRVVIDPVSALSKAGSRGSFPSHQVRELILSKKGVTLSDVYPAGGEVLMGTLRWETAERVFRLYIAGGSPNSTQAIHQLNSFCQKHLPDRHDIEIVDVLAQPKRALGDGVVLTPTLVKVAPPPIRKIIGNLSQTQTTLAALGLSG